MFQTKTNKISSCWKLLITNLAELSRFWFSAILISLQKRFPLLWNRIAKMLMLFMDKWQRYRSYKFYKNCTSVSLILKRKAYLGIWIFWFLQSLYPWAWTFLTSKESSITTSLDTWKRIFNKLAEEEEMESCVIAKPCFLRKISTFRETRFLVIIYLIFRLYKIC